MTKGEVSDLKSLIGRCIETELMVQRWLFQKGEAERQLANRLSSLITEAGIDISSKPEWKKVVAEDI